MDKIMLQKLDKIIELLQWLKDDSIMRYEDLKKDRKEYKRQIAEGLKKQKAGFIEASNENVSKFKQGLIEGLEKSGMKELAEAAKRKRLEEEEWKRRISGAS